MKNKTLIILLLIPFIAAILGFVNIIVLKSNLLVDITAIRWDYQENEGYQISDKPYLLEATPVFDPNYALSDGNDLVWTLSNKDNSDNLYAEIKKEDENYYLYALSEGEVVITCSNEKKTVAKSFNAYIYKDRAIIINSTSPSSGSSFTNIRHYGEFDLVNHDNNNLTKAKIALKITVLPDDNQNYGLIDKSNNIDFSNNVITVNNSGHGFVTLGINSQNYITSTYSFEIVEDGINVYDYNDLLACTNYSLNGEKVCLQTNLESLQNTYQKDHNGRYVDAYLNDDTKLFGNYDFNSQKFNFENEIYQFETTYNHEYIKQYFQDEYLSEAVINVGIHVQKDFYGNGFTINSHELCYPKNGKIDSYTGKLTPGDGDLFKGPKTFVSLGLFQAPFIKAYGQDNINMYVDGDNIIIDDLKIKNTNNLDNFYNLEYTGSIIDVLGENITIQNSVIQNGRTAVRAFSSDNFTLDNCLLSSAREFLLKIGNNEYSKVDSKNINIENYYQGNNLNFLDNGEASKLIMDILSNDIQYDSKLLNQIQSSLNNERNDYSSMIINDCYFYQSGIFSIAFDTYFNGLYLYNGQPPFVKEILDTIMKDAVLPNNISGTQKPVNLKITGDTRFYDYKNIDDIDASCLIEERLGELLGDFFGDEKITIDNYFPIKNLLKSIGKNYLTINGSLNTCIAFYGGGLNNSKIDILSENQTFGDSLNADIALSCFNGANLKPSDNEAGLLLAKCVPLAIGFNQFKFITNDNDNLYLNETPRQSDFIGR